MRKFLTAFLIAAAVAAPAAAQRRQPPQPRPETGVIVSIYRAAPGHQEQLLTWLARQDEISRAAGIAPSQLYVHQNGASWDFVLISPQTTPEQDEAVDASARRMGVATGPRTGLELRQHIAEHSDTLAAGPTTAAEWLRRLRQ